jgi:preprotein translocase subunit SecD
MKRPHKLLSVLTVLLLLSLSSACGRGTGRAFGPKDEGGTYLIIDVHANQERLDQSIAETMAVMQKRCEQMNIYCNLQRHGGDKSSRIMLRFSSPKDPERAKSVLLSEGLEFRAVVSPPSPAPVQTYTTLAEAAAAKTASQDAMPYAEKGEAEKFVIVEGAPIIRGQDVLDAEAINYADGSEDYQINFRLNPAGAQRFSQWTGANVNNYLAVVLNRRVRSAAYITSQIFDSGQIMGRFTKAEAEDAALILMSGSLPVPVQALEEGIYQP